MLIDLYTYITDGCALVIQMPTGVKYEAQCGGLACTHPQVEGVYFPVWDVAPDLGDCEEGCSNLTKVPQPHDKPELRKAFADKIQKQLEDLDKYSFKLRFDYERIDELQEGWWPLVITGTLYDVENLNHKCVYHRGNCD
jgi:hypothetical protein